MSAAIGNFVSDGAGKLSGIFDYNSTANTLLAQSFTGTYSLDSTGSGQLAINTPIQRRHYAVIVNPVDIASGYPAQAAAMVEQDAGEESICSVSHVEASSYVASGIQGVAGAWGQVLLLNGEAACARACHGRPQEFSGNALLLLNPDLTASAVSNFSGLAPTI